MGKTTQQKDRPVWFADGLKFECAQCGGCCGGDPGYIWVSEEEIDRLSRMVDLEREVFIKRYTYKAHRGRTLREKENGDCTFFKTGVGCTVYEARPMQCRTWPFWQSNVASYDAWKDTCRTCPGAGQGKHFSERDIRELMGKIKI